ncbi:hypothetical protein MKW92_009554 [Papaver armeniacum]|nr:hypothetical protein MKW92_009554 [Papaver armeniacum]
MNDSKKYVHLPFYRLQIPLTFILLLSLSAIIQLPKVSYACHDYERIALLHFKSTLTDFSDRLSSWKVDRHQNCCAWHGIQCSGESFHVISINLRNIDREINLEISDYSQPTPNTSLTGTISPSLFNLTHLEYLDLSFNELDYSKVQYQLSKFQNLTHLDVASSNFSGSISTQFANLSSLQYLDISGYVQTSDPRNWGYTASEFPLISSSINWVKELVHLRVLRLSGVDLSEATVQKNWAKPISFLTDLRELHLSACDISSPTFPIHEFLNLSHLSTLKMNNNNDFHSSIPIQIANLTSLSVLELAGCFSLQGSIPYLPQLQRLDVRASVNLYVNLMSMFERQWPKLQVLWMTSTYVNGSLPSSILNAPVLVSLIAPGCSIKGSLPTSIVNLSKLEYIDLSDNDITGYLPSLGSNMKNLRYLSLSNNKLQGPIPESICETSSLQQLYFSSNGLSNTIPSCITKLHNLKYLDVSSNSLEGIFSLNSLINELSLTELNFNFNNITIEIDEHFHPSKFQLKNLQLQSCNMKGHIPAFFCRFTTLNRLDLSNNNLMGIHPILSLQAPNSGLSRSLPKQPPRNIARASRFTSSSISKNIFLDLSDNQFSGIISFKVGERLSNSRYASLSSNQLSGTIPLSFCSNNGLEMGSWSIQSLNLSNNTLTGRIPTSLGNCNSLFLLHLGMNNLFGSVPNELEQAPIQYLMLNDNFLEGIFPKFIQRLEMLTVLTFGNNNYEGSIPTFVGSFKYLRILSLRANRFNGSIPKEISHLGRLQILDLSMNNLSGSIPRRLGNLTMLTSRPNYPTADIIGGDWLISDIQLGIRINGVLQYLKHLKDYSSGMDLSSNILEGNIPEEIGLLQGLSMLNLSNNHLDGKIPRSVGNMTGLDSLDISFNELSGGIPMEFTSLNSLGYLNLSYNNLSGRIPEDAHFQGLGVDGLAFLGNEFLCGIPTKKHCEGDPIGPTSNNTDDNTNVNVEDEENGARDTALLFGFVILGVGVGFWGLFLVLVCRKEKWWFRYWRAVDSVASRLTSCIPKNQ